MSTWQKYLVIFVGLYLFGALLTWVLGLKTLGPEFEAKRLETMFAAELEVLRSIARDLPTELDDMPDVGHRISPDELKYLIREMEKPWAELERRAETIENEGVVGASVSMWQDDHHRIKMELIGDRISRRTWTFLTQRTTPTTASVNKLFGMEKELVRYRERVPMDDGTERWLDLVVDADWVREASVQTTP